MKYLAIEIENEGIAANQFAPHLKKESLKVLELYEKGILREIYFDDAHCAVLILECDSKSEAENYLNSLPLVTSGLIYFNLRELHPYSGFSRLIE